MLSLSSFYLIVYIWIAVAVFTFLLLLRISAPYGRHSRPGWGPQIGNRTGWILMELPALAVPAIFFFLGQGEKNTVVWVLFLLFIVHYVNRVLVFPFRLRTHGKKMPLVIVFMAVFFNLVNGFIIGYFLGNYGGIYPAGWLSGIPFIAGLILFIAGMSLNWWADNKLIQLRKSSANGYRIPRGGVFRWVSCPNHLGEIVEWAGYAVMMWNPAGLSFAVWTAANLIPRARDHHQWYKETFEDYPPRRRAVIPHVL